MRMSIIPSDKKVGIDGEFRVVDLADIDPKIHAVQWKEDHGVVEYHTADTDEEREVKINSYDDYQVYIDRWGAATPTGQTLDEVPDAVDDDVVIDTAVQGNPFVRGLVAMLAEDKGDAPVDVVQRIKALK